MKKSFVLYNDSLDVLDELTDSQAGQILKAMRDFENGKEPKLEGILKAIWIPFRNQLKRDGEKYKEICEVKRKAGIKSGEVRKLKAERTKRTPVHSVEHNRTKRTYTDNDSDTVNENENDNDNTDEDEVFLKLIKWLGSFESITNPRGYAGKIWLEHRRESIKKALGDSCCSSISKFGELIKFYDKK